MSETPLRDSYNRSIDYMRISITDRCNLRCRYCMPPQGVEKKSHADILRYEEIVAVVRAGIELGVRSVRLTGGEPLVRPGVATLVRQLSEIEGLSDISMTTNGTLLAQHAWELKEAGLNRVNISLDSLRRDRYAEITRRNQFDEAMRGIHAALDVGLSPVKVNVVVMRGVNDDEIFDFAGLTRQLPIHVRFIEVMPLGENEEFQSETYVSVEEIKRTLQEGLDMLPAAVTGHGPARSFRLSGGKGTVGFITPISHSFCQGCNKLRITADGKIRPCLAYDFEVDLRDEGGRISDIEAIKEKIRAAVRIKPSRHHFGDGSGEDTSDEDTSSKGARPSSRNMFQIGG